MTDMFLLAADQMSKIEPFFRSRTVLRVWMIAGLSPGSSMF